MSQQSETLEIKKCVLSKLWYTSLIIHQECKNDKYVSFQNNSDTVDFVGSENLIKSLIHYENDEQNQWIIQTLLYKLINSIASNDKSMKKQYSYVQMIQALQLCKNLPIHVQQGLLLLCKNSSKKTSLEIFMKMQEEFYVFLKQNVQNNTIAICWIINELLFICSETSSDIAYTLQDIYFSLIKHLLEFKLSVQQLTNDNSIGCILCIISKMNMVEADTTELPTWIFRTLLKVCNIKDVECALYSTKSKLFFNTWCIFLNEAYAESKTAENLDDALNIQGILFYSPGTSASHMNRAKLVQRITNTKLHWVIDILDICYILLMNGKYDEVSSILSCNLLDPLWVVLLFKVLDNCPQEAILSNKTLEANNLLCNTIKFLNSRCNFHKLNDCILYELNSVLIKHIKIVEYILNWTKETFQAVDSSQIQGKIKSIDISQQKMSIKHILNLLQHFSGLTVLKMTTNIHEQEHNRIKNLLEDLCESEDIFNAYCSILSALKAILLCDTYNAKQSIIVNYFTDMKHYIQRLHPLSLRIQVIENVFCLLFLRHEDFDYNQKNCDNNKTNSTDDLLRFENKWRDQHLRGFICNKYAVREVLYYLKEIILFTKTEYMKIANENKHTDDMDQIEKQILSITVAIADAKWRLELYIDPHFSEDIKVSDDTRKSTLTKTKTNVLLDGQVSSNRFKESTLFYQESNTLDETRIKSDSSSESEFIHSNTKWRRRSRIITSIETAVNKDITHKLPFVNFMLSTKESLVIQCLWRNDYTKAQDIIEKTNMRNTQLHGEMQFSKALHTFRENIYKGPSILKDRDQSMENLQSTTLENVRLVTQEGIQSSRQTSQLETFLVSQTVNLQMLSSNTLSTNEILTICVLDLALTISQMYWISNNLCEVALKYWKLCETFENTEHARFFFQIYQLLHEKRDELSVENIICDAKISLAVKECREKDEFWSNIINKHHDFTQSQANNTTNKLSKDNNYLLSLKILGKIAAISNKNEKYVQNLSSHLQLLHTIIPAEQTIFAISDLLKIPLHYYFGNQIFELEVEPYKLETIAYNLQVNLVYSILTNAYPKLFGEKNIKYAVTSKENDCIILNTASCKADLNYKLQRPNQCVSEILTELLDVLSDLNANQFYLSRNIYKSISNSSSVKNVLSKTSRLATVDLSELSTGDDMFAFFVNTWNLMFLHATLSIWTDHPPFNDIQHSISLMTVGYLIGDLGLVTLAALRKKLLNNIMQDNTFFVEIEELNEPVWQDLDITYDPRAIFIMANEFYGTPCIRVYNTESLNEDLSKAFHAYLDYYSLRVEKQTQSMEKEKIVLPDVVKLYQNFISENYNSSTHNVRNSDNISVVDDYFQLPNRNIVIEYMTPSYAYDIILEYPKSLNIPFHKQDDNPRIIKEFHTVRSSLLQYLEEHCWIVSYLLQRIHDENPTILENNCDNLKRTACLENLLNSSWIEKLKSLFENNKTLAGILETRSMQILWSYFETMLENNKWYDCLNLLNALPDNFLINTELQCLKDKILSYIISKEDTSSNAEVLEYLYQIKNVSILSQTVLHNIKKWHINICENALLYAVHHADSYKLPAHCKFQLNEILHRVQIFHKMLPYCVTKSGGTWYDVAYCTDKIDPFQIIKALINAEKFELCLEWLECQAFSLEIHPSLTQDFLFGLLKNESQNFKSTLKFLKSLPLGQSIKVCKNALKILESIDSLQFICNYLVEHCKATETIKYRRTLLGIDILRTLETQERPLYIHIIKEPLLMLEQLIMNCKFESIQKILSTIQDKLDQVDISKNSFDEIISFYAQKSLDFRVSLQCDTTENKPKNIQHSILETDNDEFVMPTLVPTKEEWVPNDKAKECSCCKTVIFSMFNRRHHCRRCGRVICATCSSHRMHVPGYPASVMVRVCDDCKRQTVLQTRAFQGTPSTPSSEMFDYWRLTRDEKHNETIREEFSFEYAPNISLCLAILNLHFDHKTYTSFLLDRCDEMKRLLQPVSDGKINPEIDHIVIIKMIRSLLVAAKVKCAKLGLNTGLAHCDRFLSQVDLYASLVQSDCLHLIPSDNLNKRTLRKLRDPLIEKEQWTLALDVSTKAGLDTQGVWATWGKACLKMGYFDPAREKFYHCLDKIQHDDSDDWVILSFPKEPTTSSKAKPQNQETNASKDKDVEVDEKNFKKLEHSKNRPIKDPLLLTEILQILDNLSMYKHVKNTSSDTQNIYYHESLFYLLTYGSNNSILDFFLKHEEFNKCLTFTLENDLEPDLFFNTIYVYCLRNGSTERLHEAMRNRDTSLLIWKKYLIYACHCLERRQYLNILYQLQLFMKDSIRAAMTCIRFYLKEATDYTDLCSRGNFLLDAQKHLESELQVETLNRKRRKSTSSIQSNQGILTMEMEPAEIDKHINTIARQMEIVKFLANCEKENRPPSQFLSLFPGKDCDSSEAVKLPTLFGNQQQKVDLAVLAILCGRNIEEGFGIAFRIMQDYNLPAQKIYSVTGHILTLKSNVSGIEQLIMCCHTSGTPNSHIISDYVLTHCVKLLRNRLNSDPESMMQSDIHKLIRLITDTELKINAYIESKQLKTAYLLAVKHSRAQDIRKILKESDRIGQNVIKAICIKWLQQQPKL